MLKREKFIKNISDHLSWLEISTRRRVKMRLLDQNILAEDFVAKLLNIIYDYNLTNLNTINKTSIGIDLGDLDKRVCFQVTYTSLKGQREKIKDSITKFIDEKLNQQFDCLKFMFLAPKQQKFRKSFDTKNLFKFEPSEDVLDLDDLISKLPFISDEKLEELSVLIDKNLTNDYSNDKLILQQSDIETIKIYRSIFDRPALQDPFQQEGNYQDFENALTDLISLLKKGYIENRLVAKSIHEFQDKTLESELNDLYHKVRALRNLYITYKRIGEIVPEKNISTFKSSDTSDAFNKLKQDVIETMNVILARQNLTLIQGVS
ncbi:MULTISPECIES: SMEK domain-containing protein [Cyanophyceae]|uniref:SMEK domain-containing protein n=1 Tax=Cyanophyceae TaxID=3028117 RepID=UPI00232E61C3|nr:MULTISPECIES: SMEK domain-containing protein [Cyanophyceae]MDB9354821.1 SMEK domain-containing protein [Nodularia spumigena CS-587/03]MDB9316974.1 SMEK domain-containing protein [Nodularia spumigena CS-590/01A]MDB9321871.1 SMEK domain-containing protein [Nodularia spumigena CS-591/07A]MDB9328054.1 SMEK domain-containing protein [Nodularia spumigena CS-590/02]MDB9330086.1 SMEK domain-containing protein [Nodularia spumigena CS-591/04]